MGWSLNGLHGVERADTEVRRIRRQAFVEEVLELFPILPFDTPAEATAWEPTT